MCVEYVRCSVAQVHVVIGNLYIIIHKSDKPHTQSACQVQKGFQSTLNGNVIGSVYVYARV